MRDPMIERCERLMDIYLAYQLLTPKQQQAVWYHLIEGYTQQETAALCGVSREAICRRVQRAVEVMRAAL